MATSQNSSQNQPCEILPDNKQTIPITCLFLLSSFPSFAPGFAPRGARAPFSRSAPSPPAPALDAPAPPHSPKCVRSSPAPAPARPNGGPFGLVHLLSEETPTRLPTRLPINPYV